jgi:SAM-dependent methyltransferase
VTASNPFEEHTDRYDRWFENHEDAYRSELNAVRTLLDPFDRGLEIGVGTGHFAEPLGIATGIDPSLAMLGRARDRGVVPVQGIGETLPFSQDSFDAVVLVTTICFVEDLRRTLEEAHRVLDDGGQLVVGYVDSESPLGRTYREKQNGHPFYDDATFVSTDELCDTLKRCGFEDFTTVQTLFEHPDAMTEPDPVEDGRGDGSFVVLSARAFTSS